MAGRSTQVNVIITSPCSPFPTFPPLPPFPPFPPCPPFVLFVLLLLLLQRRVPQGMLSMTFWSVIWRKEWDSDTDSSAESFLPRLFRQENLDWRIFMMVFTP